jgi:hypothetical protein
LGAEPDSVTLPLTLVPPQTTEAIAKQNGNKRSALAMRCILMPLFLPL